MYTIADFSASITLSKVAVTKHGKERIAERNIDISDILIAVKNGEIIKQYEDDTPLPSCLILGYDKNNLPIHIVLSKDSEFIYLITTYRPNSDIWDDDFKSKKRRRNMICMECGAKAEKGFTTDVTDLGTCLVIVRNVPCYKCTECNEIIYTGDVVEKLESIVASAKKLMQEISVVDYAKAA